MYQFPSTSSMRLPSPRSMKSGAPPTARNARTGLFTPPGITFRASAKASVECCTEREVLVESVTHLLQIAIGLKEGLERVSPAVKPLVLKVADENSPNCRRHQQNS